MTIVTRDLRIKTIWSRTNERTGPSQDEQNFKKVRVGTIDPGRCQSGLRTLPKVVNSVVTLARLKYHYHI